MGLDEAAEGVEHRADGADRIGHSRKCDRRALERIALGLPVQRLVLPNFSNTIMASRLGPAHPLATAWNGAGAWLIFSQSRQVNFSRTVSITFHRRGVVSSVCVTSSPSLRRRLPPQNAQVVGDRSPPARASDGRGTCRARQGSG